MSSPIKFRYFTMLNNGDGTSIYPAMWTPDHEESWDGRHNPGTYWLLNVGQSKTCDLNNDKDAHGKAIGDTRKGDKFQLGCDVVAGNDDWVANQLFEYDPNSNIEVTIRKFGPLRGGDAAFVGAKVH